jgi:coproporphyrinogen III oxidase
MRGIGGIFFDMLTGGPEDWMRYREFAEDGLRAISAAYLPIVRKRMDTPFADRERRWQILRRGRYVEFNLLDDIGTRFGLQTGFNVNLLLMSLPLHAGWSHTMTPDPGTPEARLEEFLVPRDWANGGAA